MAQKSDARRSMADYSVATHAGGRTVEDARMDRYHEHVGRLRRERAVWPGAAFIVEALLLLVFLAGSLAVLMDLNADAKQLGDKSDRLLNAITMASNSAERFAADPALELYGGAPSDLEGSGNLVMANGLVLMRSITAESAGTGTLYSATITVWDEDDVLDVETTDTGYALTLADRTVEPVYSVETTAYEPGAVSLSDEATPLDSGDNHYPKDGEHLLLPVTGARALPLSDEEVA